MKTLFLASAAAAALFAAPAVAQDAIGSVGVSYANPSIDTDFGDAEADVWTVDGTVALPMNDWTVTLNGSVDYVEAFDESDTSGAAAAHFTRMFAPDVRAGAFAGVSNLGNEELWTAGVEAQKYLAQATLTGQIAYTNADDLLEGVDADIWTVGVDAAFYLTPQLRLNAGASYNNVDTDFGDGDAWTYGVGGEYEFANSPFSLTGQPNAMGGRETGSLSNLLPGHREAGNAEHRAEVAAYWGVDALPETPGLSAIELFDAVHDGRIKALWIACTNPAQSLPNQNKVHEALAACPFVVVQEAFFTTETCRHADLLLPAASWGEKEGTVTNSERRISHVRSAVPAPGEARADWAITCDFARRLERHLRPGAPSLFAFESAEALFEEYKPLTAARDLDYSGLSYALIDTLGPQQWPFPPGSELGTARLYGDGVFPTANGRARFVAEHYQAPKEKREARYPLTLNTGRLRDQWHGMSRTGTAARLFGHVEAAVLGLHPDELRRRRLQDGDLVRLRSRRGSLILPVQPDESVRPGQAWLPMHWGDRFLKGLGTNVLTQPAFDPLSKQPELKHAGVEVDKVELPWQLFALVEGEVQSRFEALRPLFEEFAYASLTPTGRERPALLIRAASAVAPQPELLAQIDRLLRLNQGPVLAYDDPRRAVGKRVRIEDGRIVSIRLAGETAASEWLRSLWLDGQADADLRRWLLAPVSAPPGNAAVNTRGKTLCNCLNVSEGAVCAGIERGLDLDGLKQTLKCGTSCGSCVPEIKRLLAQQSTAVNA